MCDDLTEHCVPWISLLILFEAWGSEPKAGNAVGKNKISLKARGEQVWGDPGDRGHSGGTEGRQGDAQEGDLRNPNPNGSEGT